MYKARCLLLQMEIHYTVWQDSKMSKRNYKREPRIIRVNPDTVRIGGGAYAALRNAEQKKQFEQKQTETSQEKRTENVMPENTERKKHIDSIKDAIGRSHYWWMDLFYAYDEYHISEEEYFEIAKYAIDLYPHQMSRVRDDKLSANNYYDVCCVMAQHGVFEDVKCEKLQMAEIRGVKDPVLDICFKVIKTLSAFKSHTRIHKAYLLDILKVFKVYSKKYCAKSDNMKLADVAENMKTMPAFANNIAELSIIERADVLQRLIGALDSLEDVLALSEGAYFTREI